MTGKGLVNGVEVTYSWSMDSKKATLADILQGKGIWLRFTFKGVDTVVKYISTLQNSDEKSFDVHYQIFWLNSDEEEVASKFDKNPITDEAEYNGFYMLSENGLLYPHVSLKSPLNGLCLKFLEGKLFDSLTGEVLNPVLD